MLYCIYITGSNVNCKLEFYKDEFTKYLMPLMNIFKDCEFTIVQEEAKDE